MSDFSRRINWLLLAEAKVAAILLWKLVLKIIKNYVYNDSTFTIQLLFFNSTIDSC